MAYYYRKKKKFTPLAWAIVCTIIGVGYTAFSFIPGIPETMIIVGIVFDILAVVYWVVVFKRLADKKKNTYR